MRILVADDVPGQLADLAQAARGPGREILQASKKDEAVELVKKNKFDLIIQDLWFPAPEDGFELLDLAKERDPDTQVIVVTSRDAIQEPERDAEGPEAMAKGAYDYIERDKTRYRWFLEMLSLRIARALEFREQLLLSERANG